MTPATSAYLRTRKTHAMYYTPISGHAKHYALYYTLFTTGDVPGCATISRVRRTTRRHSGKSSFFFLDAKACVSIRHTLAYVSMRQHTSAYLASIRQHTSAFQTPGCERYLKESLGGTSGSKDTPLRLPLLFERLGPQCTCIRQHTSAYVSIRQRVW